MGEIRDEFKAAGVEFGTQTTNGNWRLKPSGTSVIFSVLVASVFVDILTITEAGLVTVNAGNINADGATLLGDTIINDAAQAKLKFGPAGTEHGAKYDAAGFLQLWTKSNNDFKICNAEDGTVVFSIDTSAKETTIADDLVVNNDLTVTNDATVSNDLTVTNDLNVVEDITAKNLELSVNGVKLPSYATGSLPAASTVDGYFVHDSTLNKIVRSNGTTWDTM